jgi:hypothetical protein
VNINRVSGEHRPVRAQRDAENALTVGIRKGARYLILGDIPQVSRAVWVSCGKCAAEGERDAIYPCAIRVIETKRRTDGMGTPGEAADCFTVGLEWVDVAVGLEDELDSWCEGNNVGITAPMTAAMTTKTPATIVVFAVDHSRFFRPPGWR